MKTQKSLPGILCRECMCGRIRNLIQEEEENGLWDRLVVAVVAHSKLDTEGYQKSEKVNEVEKKS